MYFNEIQIGQTLYLKEKFTVDGAPIPLLPGMRGTVLVKDSENERLTLNVPGWPTPIYGFSALQMTDRIGTRK